ncbi:hypothetical protein [Arthrobacter oryzae]|uniref:Uncharacterized protein n=1 Tax=Arthrobacter oryzae TaxID=409290 RepID=A0A495EAK9_9MICC|nr:hypothetical protein [Arthrobacter oryzae]RKR13711.1 hypothetical protein C8D78_3369 [Arthrobacter oryzae]
MINDDRPSRISDESDPAMPGLGTLVIRTWHEPDQTPDFRARISYSQAPGDEPTTVSTANPDEVLSVVRQWLLDQPLPPGNV